jgi:hypothetical protein
MSVTRELSSELALSLWASRRVLSNMIRGVLKTLGLPTAAVGPIVFIDKTLMPIGCSSTPKSGRAQKSCRRCIAAEALLQPDDLLGARRADSTLPSYFWGCLHAKAA